MLFCRNKKFKKRDCGVKMRLVPYGGGWTDVHMDIGGDSLYFIISSYEGQQFDELLKALYHIYPKQSDSENADYIVESVDWVCEDTDEGYRPLRPMTKEDTQCVYVKIPWKAQFEWDSEEVLTKWKLERKPDNSADFMLHIEIEEENQWDCDVPVVTHKYDVSYKDMCYAVAKACTDALKKHGFYGYHQATYYNDINIRHLLFLKAVALNNFEARKLTFYQEKGKGETSSFEREIELLLADM